MINIEKYKDILKHQFNNGIEFFEKRPGLNQVYAPFFHEDGDMFDVFIEQTNTTDFRISDQGLTLMRLSYEFDLDTENKKQILNKIIFDNYGKIENGNIFIESTLENIFNSLMQYYQLISKVSNMDILKRENIRSIF